MPPRSDLLRKRWSTVELPILPFLAPRVFTPWPCFGRRAHSGAQTAQKLDTNVGIYDIKLQETVEGDELHQKRDFTLLRLSPKDSRRPKLHVGSAVDKVATVWANISNLHRVDVASGGETKDDPSGYSSDDQFRKKFGEIWGTGEIHPSQRMDLPAGKVLRKDAFPISESSQSLVSVQAEIAAIVGNKKTASSHPCRNATESRQAEPELLESKDVETFGKGQQETQAKGRISDHTYARPNAVEGRRFEALPPSQQPFSFRWKQIHGGESQPKGFRRPRLHGMGSLKAPIKFARWSPGQGSGAFLKWNTSFARLVRLENFSKPISSTERIDDLSLYKSLIESESSISLRAAWETLPPDQRQDIWPEMTLRALEEHPTKILKFLVATHNEPYPPTYAVSDSFDYIISYYLDDRIVENPKNALEILRAFEQLLHRGPLGHIELSQKSVYLLLKNLDDVSAGILFQLLTEVGHPLTEHTLMHFPSKVRLAGGPDERIDMLTRLWHKGSDFNSPKVLSICATILQRKDRSAEMSHSDSEIFEFMLECGMKPNIIIYNVLLQNSLEANDYETAWQIHDMMVDNGIETDAYTYSLLLTDAKLRGDRVSVKRILNIVGERNMQNAHVATDILHTIYLFRQQHDISPHWEEGGSVAKPFKRMLTVYRQYFRLEPLARIIPWLDAVYLDGANSLQPTKPEESSPANDSLMEPAVPTVVVMLTGLLGERNDPGVAVRLYHHFCDLVKAGDPVATALSQSTQIYNIILMALGRFPETLALCPRLIGDMLSQHSEVPSTSVDSHCADEAGLVLGSPPAANPRKLHPKPDIYTWSILLKVFMDHGQPRAAEKVLSMMEERKVWPNQVTWNSLTIGYARMQDMTMTVNAVHRLKSNGYDLDGVTMKGLSFFQNRRALIEALKASEATDPGRSIKKRGAAYGKAATALKQTLRLVKDGVDTGDLQRRTEESVYDDDVMHSTGIDRSGDGELVVGDIPREEDKEVDLD